MRLIKKIVKKFTPPMIINIFYIFKAYLATFFYGFPSKHLTVIGITGTKGKSTSVYMLGKIFQEAGFKVGWSSSMSFYDGKKEMPNPFHMTMASPFIIQKILKKMLKNKVQFAILEVTSEGIKQYRHLGIYFKAAILTNLQPEHIEAHGGFENYKRAKMKLFEAVSKNRKNGIIIVNGDDENAKDFLAFDCVQKWVFKKIKNNHKIQSDSSVNEVYYKIINSDAKTTKFIFNYKKSFKEINLNLIGAFNASNASAAGTAALAFGIKIDTIKKALEKIKNLPGRMEFINQGQDFKVIIDLAHTPDSFKAVFESVKKLKTPDAKIITLFGAAGGSRDKWKRPVMGKIAGQNSDYIILTNEDPYDDDPQQILLEIKSGINDYDSRIKECRIFEILDRELAIKKAIEIAKKNDIVLLLGKGTEATMVFEKGKFILWNEKEIVKKYLKNKIGAI